MKEVIVYSSNTCQYCASVKELLNESNIPYQVKNISENKEYRKELMKLGYMSVPVTLIDGEIVLGYDKEKIELLLSK